MSSLPPFSVEEERHPGESLSSNELKIRLLGRHLRRQLDRHRQSAASARPLFVGMQGPQGCGACPPFCLTFDRLALASRAGKGGRQLLGTGLGLIRPSSLRLHIFLAFSAGKTTLGDGIQRYLATHPDGAIRCVVLSLDGSWPIQPSTRSNDVASRL